ncbi:atrial natriuretic peptide receptor 1-like [Ptychodera flava]|uniref:atrial natriuretic peptide receptor 1-like n=1 Tax=Ptychodera flava TaxID=63121 RepID=UPI003969F54A
MPKLLGAGMRRLAGALAFLLMTTHPFHWRTDGEEMTLLVMLWISDTSVVPVILDLALEKINSDPNMLQGYNLTYELLNSGCNPTHTLGTVVDLLRHRNYSAFIGPYCTSVCRHTARLAAYYNIPTFSPICSGNEMMDKDEFPTLIRTYGSQYKQGGFFRAICDAFTWGRFSIISGDGNMPVYADGIKLAAERANITVSLYKVVRESHLDRDLEVALKEAAKVSRIIVFCVSSDSVRQTMVMVHKLGLVGGEFAFVSLMFDVDTGFDSYSWRKGENETEDQMAKEAFSGLLFLAKLIPHTDVYRDFNRDVLERYFDKFNRTYYLPNVPQLGALLYDAVYLYAFSLDETLRENGSAHDGYTIAKRLYGRKYLPGVVNMTIDDNGDRDTDFMLIDVHFPDDKDFEMITVAEYHGHDRQLKFIPGVKIQWPGIAEGPPLDTPLCGYEGELCLDRAANDVVVVLVSVICVILATLAVVSAVFYRRFKSQQKLTQMLWKIAPDELIFEQRSAVSGTSMISHPSLKTELNEDHAFTTVAVYKGMRCAIAPIDAQKINLSHSVLIELNKLREVSHANLVRFIGACIDPPTPCFVVEYCSKGSLQDILGNDSITLDWMFRYSLTFDIVKGMHFIHNSFIKYHGNLKSSNCVVDSRFVLKVTDFGVMDWRDKVDVDGAQLADYYNLFWRAPELLRKGIVARGSQKGDVYSFGIILNEIATRQGPYETWLQENMQPEDIIKLLKNSGQPPFRPELSTSNIPDNVKHLIEECWSENPYDRPDFTKIKLLVRDINRKQGNSGSILDNLLSRMEQYATNLEGVVAERTKQLVEEKKKSELLLEQLLPRPVAEQLKRGNAVAAEAFDSVTIFFSDIVGFTALSAASTPLQVVDLLNDLYTCFDAIIDNFDVYKVETIGDAYMVVSGLPIKNGNLHAREIARMSLTMLKAVYTFEIRHRPSDRLKLRIGIHSGPVVAGVVGLKMPRYCLFGDTVNTASRMESSGLALKIHVSNKTAAILDAIGGFRLDVRGEIEMKGKGVVTTYWLLEELTIKES